MDSRRLYVVNIYFGYGRASLYSGVEVAEFIVFCLFLSFDPSFVIKSSIIMSEKSNITKIYFDMDGVLADFERGVRELCGIEPIGQGSSTDEQTDRLWEAVKKVPHFYLKLEPVKDAAKLFNEVRAKFIENCQILTGIPKPRRGIENAGDDKIAWAHKFLSPDVKVNVVFREEKTKFCFGKNCVLIDGYEKNISEWENADGRGILFTSAEEARKELEKMLSS